MKCMDKNLGFFRKTTGTLCIPSMDLLINKKLRRENFINKYAPYLLYSDMDFFMKYGFFHFSQPIIIRRRIFRLSVFFLSAGTSVSDVCTGFGLSSYKYNGSGEDTEIEGQFENFLIEQLGAVPVIPPHTTAKVWRLKWGTAYLGATQQNGTEPEIKIGWEISNAVGQS